MSVKKILDMGEVKMVLFGRWLVTQHSYEELMSENSMWYRKQVKHFELVVLPNYKKNGTVDEHIQVFNNSDILKNTLKDIKKNN